METHSASSKRVKTKQQGIQEKPILQETGILSPYTPFDPPLPGPTHGKLGSESSEFLPSPLPEENAASPPRRENKSLMS